MKIKRDIVLTIGYLLSLAVLAAVGYAFGDYTAEKHRHEQEMKEVAAMNPHFASSVAFVDLPRISVSLASTDGGSGRVRIDMSLEVDKKYLSKVQNYQPIITDKLVQFVRKLDSEDMSRPNAGPKLRQEILKQVNSGISPAPIMDVVFRQFLFI